MSSSYKSLCTEFYDIDKPIACNEELLFYESMLKKSPGPFLEAMCGSGRLMIPLIEKGFTIDGIDISPSMLESLERRLTEKKLKADLFLQPLEELHLPKKYGLIFIAVGSFQLIADMKAAKKALKAIHNHLLPGGTLLIDTFVPWDFIAESIQQDKLQYKPKEASAHRRVYCPDGTEIHLNMTIITNPFEQLSHNHCHYEKLRGPRTLAAEEEEIDIRWYYRYEMQYLIESAGFTLVNLHDKSFVHNPQSLIFQAERASQ